MRTLILLAGLLIYTPAQAAEVTANTVLKRGTLLQEQDISVILSDGEQLTDIHKTYIGQQLKRTVYAGHRIDVNYLGAPVLVKRNAQVSIVYSSGALRLTAKGRALEPGALGDLITVMNNSSRKKITAIVKSTDIVEVGQ